MTGHRSCTTVTPSPGADLQGELQGVPVNVAQPLGRGRWSAGGSRHSRWTASRTCARGSRPQPQPRHGLGRARLAGARRRSGCIPVEPGSSVRGRGGPAAGPPATRTARGHGRARRGGPTRHGHAGASRGRASRRPARGACRAWAARSSRQRAASSVGRAAPACRGRPGSMPGDGLANALRRDAGCRSCEAQRAAASQRWPRPAPVEAARCPTRRPCLSYLANVVQRVSAAAFDARGTACRRVEPPPTRAHAETGRGRA
jgi:hypothetical protein